MHNNGNDIKMKHTEEKHTKKKGISELYGNDEWLHI